MILLKILVVIVTTILTGAGLWACWAVIKINDQSRGKVK